MSIVGNKSSRRKDPLRTLYTTSSMLKQIEADNLDIDTVLDNILKVTIKQLDAKDGNGSIIVYDDNLEAYRSWYSHTPSATESTPHFVNRLMVDGFAGWCVKHNKQGVIASTLEDDRWLALPKHETSQTAWSVICAPLTIRSRPIGAVTIQKPGINQFDKSHEMLILAIATQVGSNIENALLYEESQRQLKISALLNEASRTINSSLDIDTIMHTILAQASDPLKAEAISIALVKGEVLEYQVAVGAGAENIIGLQVPQDRGVSGWVMKHGQPTLVVDAYSDSRFSQDGDQRTGHPTRSMICAPMRYKGRVLGTIQAINALEDNFKQQDLKLLTHLANIASTALANAQQYAELRATQESYRNLFEDNVNPIIITDTHFAILSANKRTIALLGYELEEIQGMSMRMLYPIGTELPSLRSKKQLDIKPLITELIPKETAPIPVEIYGKPTIFNGQERWQWIHHDVSHRIELEKMRRELTAMLFHDLQSPLGNVLSSLEMIVDEIDENSMAGIMADVALRSGSHLQSLVRSLLDIERLESGQPVSERDAVYVGMLFDDILEIENPKLQAYDVALVCHLPEGLPPIYAQTDMIRRVLVNLVDNAIKHSGEDSEQITIMAERLNTNMIQLSVSDQGRGIPARYRKTIFDKYKQIKEHNSKGLGLGLAFCRLAVEAHGGTIWVDEAQGGGARFNFTIPVYE